MRRWSSGGDGGGRGRDRRRRVVDDLRRDRLRGPGARDRARRSDRSPLQTLGARTDAARAVVAGLTGVEPRSNESRTAARMIHELTRAPVVHATWDAEIAYFGASV